MSKTLYARFARKPRTLDEVLHNDDPQALPLAAQARPERIEIAWTQKLSTAEYDDFANNLLADRAWLAERGGYLGDSGRRVVKVTARNRTTLYVDPSGSSYGRYVGVRVG